MPFDPMPESIDARRRKNLGHAQEMLNLIGALGSYSEDPLPQFNYGQQTNQLNTDVGKDFAATLLMAQGGSNPIATGGGGRPAAIKRRLNRRKP